MTVTQSLGAPDHIERILDSMKGDRMYAVTFILDYIELQFDDHGVNAYSPLSVIEGQKVTRATAPDFRNVLCSQIGENVVSVSLQADALLVAFRNAVVRLSLQDTDYAGPEAGQLFSPIGELIFRADGVHVIERGVS